MSAKQVTVTCEVTVTLNDGISQQAAIAEILSGMDAEIRAVEEKLSKARGQGGDDV